MTGKNVPFVQQSRVCARCRVWRCNVSQLMWAARSSRAASVYILLFDNVDIYSTVHMYSMEYCLVGNMLT
jgi:hypothetical protein